MIVINAVEIHTLVFYFNRVSCVYNNIGNLVEKTTKITRLEHAHRDLRHVILLAFDFSL